jgi:hypothetical protein
VSGLIFLYFIKTPHTQQKWNDFFYNNTNKSVFFSHHRHKNPQDFLWLFCPLSATFVTKLGSNRQQYYECQGSLPISIKQPYLDVSYASAASNGT